ncbi:putative calcium-transporting ATPase [Lupinus albus]|uniref:Putative calcium-transporting ATPase n=1 Tax=Lupinus albus TaxID=3870 RepID=A0A6A4PVF9_LUPAL|nr:putative calcium-transporting ATPase [Lupinus albus]
MLLITAVMSFATELKKEGPECSCIDGVAILFAVILMVASPSIANFWRERKMKLSKKLEFTVKRGEEYPMVVAISDIVVGDKVFLIKDDKVPANGLFLHGDNLLLAESLKGKSDSENNPFIMAGSNVIEGYGWMLVTSVESKINLDVKIGLLECKIEKPISYIDKFALTVSTLVAFVVLIRLVCKKDVDSSGIPEIKGKVSLGMVMEVINRIFFRPQGKVSILTGLLISAILCMQHGMPLMIAISLKCQIDKVVSNHDVVINDLSACTTMGLVTVICIDASGGIVAKPLEVSRIWMGDGDISKVEGSESHPVLPEVLQQGVGLLSALTSGPSFSPMPSSLVSWAETCGMNINSSTKKFKILRHRILNSDRECVGALVSITGDNEQVWHCHWSGAASTILEMCSQYCDSKGECHVMVNEKVKFEQVIKEMEDNGLKTIAFAYRKTQVQELEQDGLIFLGLIGLKDTSPESNRLALEYLRSAGIQIKLVSEDDIMEVRAIASELGLEVQVDGSDMLEGKELEDMNHNAILDKVDVALVMGGFGPEEKLLMVQCLQEKGHVVAFIGRLTTSNASVLKVADVGIVHSSLSTIVNRESSSICIKCFSALKPILRAGRSKYYNIQKFIQLQLTLSISGSLITLITTMSTEEPPLTPIQLIWVNMLMCILGGSMMVMELKSQEQLPNQPYPSNRKRNESVLTNEIIKSIVIQVLYQASVSMIFEFGGHVTEMQKQVRKTMIFNTFLLCQVFNQLNNMHFLKMEVLKIVVKSYCFLVAIGACFVMQVLVIEYAKGLANCMKQNATQWFICVFVGALSWVFEWGLKHSQFIPCFRVI